MKTFTLAFLVILFAGIQPARADRDSILLKDSTIWCYCHYNTFAEIYEYYRYILDGDTVINDHFYKKMYKYTTETYKKETAKYITSIRKENNIIYCPEEILLGFTRFMPARDGETFLYDFTKKNGDLVGITEDGFPTLTIKDKQTIYLDDMPRTIFYLDQDIIWIEDLGILKEDFFNPLCVVANDKVWLDMYIEEGKIIYGKPDFSFLTEGNQWIERVTDLNNKELYSLNSYIIEGDTLIHDKAYKKLYENNLYKGALRENIEHKIFYYEEGKPEILLYDFHWMMPRDYHFTNYSGNDFSIGLSQFLPEMELADGKMYQYYDLTENPNPDGASFFTINPDVKLIRNIGLTAGIFKMTEVGKEDPSCYTDLVSFYGSDGHLIYQNPYFDEEGVLTSIDHSSAKAYLCVSWQGNQVTFSLPLPVNKEEATLRLYHIDGRAISSYPMDNGTVTVSGLEKGIYLYRLDGGTIKAETGKFVVGN